VSYVVITSVEGIQNTVQCNGIHLSWTKCPCLLAVCKFLDLSCFVCRLTHIFILGPLTRGIILAHQTSERAGAQMRWVSFPLWYCSLCTFMWSWCCWHTHCLSGNVCQLWEVWWSHTVLKELHNPALFCMQAEACHSTLQTYEFLRTR